MAWVVLQNRRESKSFGMRASAPMQVPLQHALAFGYGHGRSRTRKRSEINILHQATCSKKMVPGR